MTDRPRILFVSHGDVGGTIRAAVERTGYRAIETTSGMDALKRLEYESFDVVVVPSTLPDLPVGVFVRRIDHEREVGPCVVVGDVDRAAGPMIQLAADVSVDSLADRITRAIQDRRIGDEFDRHERLKNGFLRIAGSIYDAEEDVDVLRILYEGLGELHAFRFVLVGTVGAGAEAMEIRYPIRRRVDIEAVGAFVGAADDGFIARAIHTRSVTQTSEPVFADDGDEDRATDSDADSDGLTLTAVPLADRERTYGLAILATDAGLAPDSTERSVLGRIGRICGLELESASSSRQSVPDRNKELFLAIAHELRNPLQIAMMSLDSARRDGDEVSFDRVASALETMTGVIDTIVEMASDEGVTEVEPVDVHNVAATVWHSVCTPSSELTIAKPVTVEADPAMLERLLSNLLRNAIDHGGEDVSVRVGALPDGCGFFVEDDGPGISPDRRETVFDWGETADSGGLGVGLGFVREIADAHDWEVRATGGSEGGARFEVRTAEHTRKPRDSLAALFSEGSREFEFPDSPSDG